MTSQSPPLAILWQNTPIPTLDLMREETCDHQKLTLNPKGWTQELELIINI